MRTVRRTPEEKELMMKVISDFITKATIEGNIIHNAKCDLCGDSIPTAKVRRYNKIICKYCHDGGGSKFCLGNGYDHFHDDPSGPSGSWDQAVKCYEGDYNNQ